MLMSMMRKFVVLTTAFFVLTASSGAGAVNIDWITISDAGNVADDTGYGSVASSYRISRHEVTVGQYAEFLNAKASSDPYALFSTLMDTYQGITRQGTSGSYSYDVEVGRENRAMGHVSFANALRLANWMNNGQGSASTEAGAYDISLGTMTSGALQREAGATIFLPSEDEWYKAAYYDSLSSSYFEYPTFSDSPGSCSSPTSAPNSANCNSAAGANTLTDVGSYSNSQSPYGTFDQGGNVWEWNESFLSGDSGGLRGGGNGSNQATGAWGDMRASYRGGDAGGPVPGGLDIAYGFRLGAVIPEPSTGLLVSLGLIGLSAVNRRRRVA